MSLLRKQARRFVHRYSLRRHELVSFARLAEAAVHAALKPVGLELHVISVRVKHPRSAVAKIRRKKYGNPGRQLTDMVGVRVITYYQDDVDRAASALRDALEIDPRHSVDKRQELQLRQFGYRSVHLIARFGDRDKDLTRAPYRQQWFEIQVRSILEHAWAEIEHEVCYKSGITYPDPVLRRFGALAGTLEVLEGQFQSLRSQRDELIDEYKQRLSRNQDLGVRLDSARLVAYLENTRPDGMGWRGTSDLKRPFMTGLETVCVEALAAAGIRTPRSLGRALSSKPGRRLLRAFASLAQIGANEVSHFAACVIAIAMTKPTVLQDYPELRSDSRLLEVLPKSSTWTPAAAAPSAAAV